MNKVLEVALANVCHAICVSYVSKQNTFLRTKMKPEKIYVIPNAVDTKVCVPRIIGVHAKLFLASPRS